MEANPAKVYRIGLVGPIGCGKSYTAKKIASWYPQFVPVSFAFALKAEVAAVTLKGERYPWGLLERTDESEMRDLIDTLSQLRANIGNVGRMIFEDQETDVPIEVGMDPFTKPTPPMMRKALQLWGTEFRRKQDGEYWVKQLMAQVDALAANGTSCVCDDVRFPNEMIFDQHWYVWNEGAERQLEETRGNHASEGQIKKEDCNLTIHNDFGNEFAWQLRAAVDGLLRG